MPDYDAATPTKHCPKCNTDKPIDNFNRNSARHDGRDNYCNPCRREYDVQWSETPVNREKRREWCRTWRYLNPDLASAASIGWQQRNPEKSQAHQKVFRAITSGRLDRPDHCACGIECKPEGHHDDYSKPLEVVWLCRACHKRTERKKREGREERHG